MTNLYNTKVIMSGTRAEGTVTFMMTMTIRCNTSFTAVSTSLLTLVKSH